MRSLRRLATLEIAGAGLLLTLLSPVTLASASPPSGVGRTWDLARAQIAEASRLHLTPGTGVAVATYSLAPGGSSGWRRFEGPLLLAVTAGTLTLTEAEGCRTREIPTGQAVVAPAGAILVANTGGGPLRFAGEFYNLAPGGRRPLVGAPDAPESCAGLAPAAAPTSPGLEMADFAAATLGSQYRHHGDRSANENNGDIVVDLDSGKDVYFFGLEFQPGFSAGWFDHRPTVAMISSGTLTYYEGRDGRCVKTDEYGPGQAYFHPPHVHFAANEGTETVTATFVGFNLPHAGPTTLPVVGNLLDYLDVTPLPPADCPRLR